MPDSVGGTGDAEPGQARPSFTGYWKRSKDQQAAQNLTFVSSKLGQPTAQDENGAQSEPFAEAKAKARRQQVRNAQRQHRQRKANYTKQLELDITKLRDDIAKVEEELEALRSKNGTIKAQLAQPTATMADPLPAHMAFSTSLAPQYTVSLDMSKTLGTPAYRVSRASPGVSSSGDSSSAGGDSGAGKTTTATETVSSTTTPASTVGTSLEDVAVMETALSEEQIDRVINFVLALEHCCWNHIDKSAIEQNHHHHHHHHQAGPDPKSPDEQLNGHTLMATSLALQGAPPSILTHMEDLAAPTTTTTASTSSSAVAWPSRALTLTNLRRLAGTLNASGATELAPVQVWFELAGLYGVGVATNGSVLARLECAFAGEVRCVMFGAAVQRDVFETVVEKVVGYLPRAWSPPPARTVDVEEEGDGQAGGEEEGEDMMSMGMMGDEEADEEELREDMAAMGMDMDMDADMEMLLGGMSNQVPGAD
ncbi:hypothetical protein F5Y03DRAFT_345865 [Xylaria venustula]|nr:hypothetical protein F5Y03DRAFT_345865 [Xylaria venustula]